MASFLDVIKGLVSRNTIGNQKSVAPGSGVYDTGLNPNSLYFDPNQASFYNPSQQGASDYAAAYQNATGQPFTGAPGTESEDLGMPGSGTGGASSGPNLSVLQNQVRDRISAIQSAYDALNGGIDQVVNERAGQYNQNYDQQLNDLNKAYGNNVGQQANAYGARGLQSSSYYTNAQNDANDVYNQNIQNLLNDKNQTLGQLGQFAASNKAQFGNARNQYNDILGQLGNYSADTLQGLYSQLGTQLGGVQAQQAGLGTNAQFLGDLNKITPVQNQGASQLAQKLQQLVTSGVPHFAKSQIAQGLIKSAQLTDPNAQNYWQNYFQQLLSSGGA